MEQGEHQEAVLDVKDATCYVTGYTGDTYCSVCNIKLAVGTVTPKLEHTLSFKQSEDYYNVVKAKYEQGTVSEFAKFTPLRADTTVGFKLRICTSALILSYSLTVMKCCLKVISRVKIIIMW